MKKEVLRAQPMYGILAGLYLATICIFLLFVPDILNWEMGPVGYKLLFYFLIVSSMSYGFFASFTTIQYAVITDTTITIKGFFMKPVTLAWKDIKRMCKERIVTQHSRGVVSFLFVVIKTDKDAKTIAAKKQTPSCCQIFASKKNVAILRKYALKYNIPFDC